jgi:penicillin amidase
MLTAFRWTLRAFVALLVIGALVLLVIYYFVSRSLPDYNATWAVPGISAPVEIVRNNSDVPHIFATTDNDAYYALGFAHAQDRLWQMTLLRRTVQGRLSEMFGEKTLKTDELMHRLDLYNLALSSVAAQDDYTKRRCRPIPPVSMPGSKRSTRTPWAVARRSSSCSRRRSTPGPPPTLLPSSS